MDVFLGQELRVVNTHFSSDLEQFSKKNYFTNFEMCIKNSVHGSIKSNS